MQNERSDWKIDMFPFPEQLVRENGSAILHERGRRRENN